VHVLNQLPFLKILFPFIGGIALTILWPVPGGYSGTVLLSLVLILIILAFRDKDLNLNSWMGFIISLIFLCLGSLLTHYKDPQNHKYNLRKAGLDGVYLIRVSEIPQIKAGSVKIKSLVLAKISGNRETKIINETVLLYFSKKIKIPEPGDELIINCGFQTIPEPENPFQFDYKWFLKCQGIYYRTFLNDPKDVLTTEYNGSSLLEKFSNKGIRYLHKIFTKSIQDKTILGVTESLIFGYKDDLQEEITDAYAKTGTLHVLAVSGLHVAIVFLMLSRFLWFMDKWRYGTVKKTILILIAIWGYCLITGMAPSIIRAGIMISLLVVGKAINRDANTFNIISVSAFIILCINPWWLVNIGFQLSFAAVIGIVYLGEYLLKVWTPTNWLSRQIWEILIITVCAQIATFPISIYYFHQFPNYFLISNLIIIPLTSIILYTGIGMAIFYKVPVLFKIFTWLTIKLTGICNGIVIYITGLPYSITDGIKLNIIQIILIYICIPCFVYWVFKVNRKGMIWGLGSITLIIGISFCDKITLQKESSVNFFNIPYQNAIIITDGRKCVLISDDPNNKKQMYYVKGWLVQKRLWPIYRRYDFKQIMNKSKIESMDLNINKGILNFKGLILNLSTDSHYTGKTDIRYILPEQYNWNELKQCNPAEKIFIGNGKKRKTELKIKNRLSEKHICVIMHINAVGYTIVNPFN